MAQVHNSPFYHDEWNHPLPLPEGVPLQPWPSSAFPEPFESFAKELARSSETPIELSSMITLSAVAAIAQKNYEVQIKADYTEPLNIWVAAILPPSSRKSRIYSVITKPLREWETEQKQAKIPIVNSINSKRKTIEARLKHLRSNAAKAKDENDFLAYQQKIEKLEEELPNVPTFPQIWTGDVTPEHLGTIMAANDEAMAVLSDEGGIFDILGGLYSDGRANIDLFLQSHAASSVRVDRGSRPPVLMQRPVLTMGLTVQPETVSTICKNKTFRGRGLLGRFLYVIPPSNIGKRKLDVPPMSDDIRREYEDAIKSLFNYSYPPNKTGRTIYKLHMSSQAYDKWLEYAKMIELLMGEEIGRLTHITDWAGKLAGAIARIAGLLHIMRHLSSLPQEHSISYEDMRAATKIGYCLINHALTVFELIQKEESVEIACAILKWVKDSQLQQFTLRECERKFRRYKKKQLESGVKELKEYGYLKEWKHKTGGAPSIVLDVNPYFFDDRN